MAGGGFAPSFDIGASPNNRAETSTPWGVTLKPVRRISKVVVVEEGDGDLAAVGLGQSRMMAPKIMVDETPKSQSVSGQKAGDGKVKSPGTDVAELSASSSSFAYYRVTILMVKSLSLT